MHYSAADIERYRRGEMLPPEMHAMEKAALDDPFLADAIEGYANTPIAYRSGNDIADLQQRLEARIKKDAAAAQRSFGWWKAAAIILMLAGSGWLYSIVSRTTKNDIAARQTQGKESLPPVAAKPIYTQPVLPAKTDSAYTETVPSAIITPPVLHQQHRNRADKNTPLQQTAVSAPLAANKAIIDSGATPARSTLEEPAAAQMRFRPQAGNVETRRGIAEAGKSAAASRQDESFTPSMHIFNGLVMDQASKPLPNARIQVPGLNIAAVTNNKGYFSFKAPDTALQVSIASVGYESRDLELVTNNISDAANIVHLKPSLLSLNEVAATDYGARKKRTKTAFAPVAQAMPAAGWKEYHAYLEKNKALPAGPADLHGEVIVSFTIDGKHRPRHFNIEKSLGKAADAEAVRLVREGPPWKLLKGKKARALVTIIF